MQSLKNTYRELVKALKDNKIENVNFEARWIIQERTKYFFNDVICSPDAMVTDEQHKNIFNDIKQRKAGKPLSRIYGHNEFWGLDFQISKDTLDPRDDTELIIELALSKFDINKPLKILDLGTGSGCILISLLYVFENAYGYGVDLSEGALKIAQKNDFTGRAHFICSSWLDSISGKFDLIVSNPPYIKNHIIPTLSKEVRNYDPILSLDGGMDGLTPYKIIFPQLKNYLKSDGLALFEIGYDQEKEVLRLAEKAGFMQSSVHLDLSGNPRVVDISGGD